MKKHAKLRHRDVDSKCSRDLFSCCFLACLLVYLGMADTALMVLLGQILPLSVLVHSTLRFLACFWFRISDGSNQACPGVLLKLFELRGSFSFLPMGITPTQQANFLKIHINRSNYLLLSLLRKVPALPAWPHR